MPPAIAICNIGGGSGISIYVRPTALCRICNVTSRNLSLTGAPHFTIYYIRVLIHCPKYDKERAKLIKNVGAGGMWIERLLGHPKIIKFTLDYVKETGRFGS
jgi:hypothetical protein